MPKIQPEWLNPFIYGKYGDLLNHGKIVFDGCRLNLSFKEGAPIIGSHDDYLGIHTEGY